MMRRQSEFEGKPKPWPQFSKRQRGRIRLVRSPAHDFENEQNPREDRRLATLLWLETAGIRVSVTPGAAERAREIAALGFAPLDALHLAFAEKADARWFVTTDDRLAKRASSHSNRLVVEVRKPDELSVDFLGDAE